MIVVRTVGVHVLDVGCRRAGNRHNDNFKGTAATIPTINTNTLLQPALRRFASGNTPWLGEEKHNTTNQYWYQLLLIKVLP